MNNLSSAVSALTSKLNDAGLQILAFKTENHKKSFLSANSNIPDCLSIKYTFFFPFTVGNQEQKQTETQKLLDNLKSAITSLQSDQQDKQRDSGKTHAQN